MKNFLLLIWSLSILLCADFSNNDGFSASEKRELEKIRKELQIDELSEEEKKLIRIRKELNLEDPSEEEKELDSIRDELNIGYAIPKNESRLDRALDDVKDKTSEIGDSFDDAITSVKDKINKKEEPKGDKGFSFQKSLSDFQETLGFDLDIPSIFGTKKKKDSSFLGSGFLGGIKDTGTSLYKGAKYSGQSAELMSGMMYNSSKMYNTMFGVFDDSPFNIFEEEEEEASVFDVFEQGNLMMDLFN